MLEGSSRASIHRPATPCLIARVTSCPFAARRRNPGSYTTPEACSPRGRGVFLPCFSWPAMVPGANPLMMEVRQRGSGLVTFSCTALPVGHLLQLGAEPVHLLRENHGQVHRFAGQLLQLGAEPVHPRTAMAKHHARPGSLDINPDGPLVPADPYLGYPGRPRDRLVYRVSDLVDVQILNRHDLRPGGDLGLPDPGQLEVVGQQPVRHLPLDLVTSRGEGAGCLVGQLQVHVRIQVHPQRHSRLARATPSDDHPAGGGVLLPGLGHPGPDLLLERTVVSHAMSLAAMLPPALIPWPGTNPRSR